MEPFTIEGLRERDYPGGTINIRSVLTTTATFTRYYIDYPSDNLTITGIMQIPPGDGPFPVVLLNHGYIPQSRYWSGADTWRAAEYLNAHGYLTLSSDFRTWGSLIPATTFSAAACSSMPSIWSAPWARFPKPTPIASACGGTVWAAA